MNDNETIVIQSESIIENFALTEIKDDLFPKDIDYGVRKFVYEFREYSNDNANNYKHMESGMEFNK